MKNADFKIRSFLTKNRGLTPWKKVDFWRKYKFSSKSFQPNQCVLKRPLRHTFDFQGRFKTHRDPYGYKQVKNANFKIWSFLTKNRGLTPWKKVDVWTKYKFSSKSFQSNQCVLKRPLRHTFDFQGRFKAHRDPYGYKQVKNAHFKIWSFLTKTVD